jgi:hypothetical protein
VQIAQLYINGVLWKSYFTLDDAIQLGCDGGAFLDQVLLTPSELNGLLTGGDLVLELRASPAVNGTDCPDAYSRLEINYLFNDCEGSDCNGNGIPDDCDLQVFGGESIDANGDFIPDECQVSGACFGSSGCNAADVMAPFGTLDLGDIGAFVSAFANGDPLADFDSNGLFDLADITVFVQAFSAGCP